MLEGSNSKIGRMLSVLLPVAAILFCLLWFYRAFVAGEVFGWEDELFVFYPGANYFAKSIADGVFPFWLPGMRCGMPFYSDVQMGLFYPLKWILVLFVKDGVLSQQAYQIYQVFQLFVGGCLFYGLMRMHKTERLSSAAGALVYCLSGFTALHIVFSASIEVMLWLPLVLMAITYYFQKKCLLRVLLISLSILMTFLPGFPQVTVYISYFSIGYWLVLAFYDERAKGGSWRSLFVGLLKELGVVIAAFLLAILMGAMVFLPAFENWKLSHRAAYGYDKIADTSMPFYYVVNMFFPNFTGVMKPVGDAVQYWGFNKDSLGFEQYKSAYWHYWDLSCYAGQIGIIALLYSVAFLRSFWKSPLRLFCTLGAVFALWFMLGRYGGLFKVLYEVLPGISAFRGPARMSCVMNAAQAILVAYFISDLIRGDKLLRIRRFLLVVLGGYVLFLVAFLSGGKEWCIELGHEKVFAYSLQQILVGIGFTGILCGVAFLTGRKSLKKFEGIIFSILFLSVFMDLYTAHGNFHKGEINAADYYADKGQLISQIQSFQKQNGICRFAQVRNGKIKESVVMPRNMGYMKDIEVPEGYVLFTLSSHWRLRGNLSQETLRDLLNIGIIAEQTSRGIGVRVRKDIMPRAVFYSQVATFDSRDELLAAVSSGKVSHKKQVAVLKSDVAGVQFSEVEKPYKKCSARKINNNQWKISLPANGPGIVFVSQSFYPGWKAIDSEGNPLDVIETFGGLAGIVVPETITGEITFEFYPGIFKISMLVSAISILVVVGYILRQFFQRKNQRMTQQIIDTQ